MRLDLTTGTVMCKCSKCGQDFGMNPAKFVTASMAERITCPTCRKKGVKKKK